MDRLVRLIALGFALALSVDVGLLDAVFHIAQGLARSALGLVDGAFGAQLFVAGRFTDRVLGRARCLIQRAFCVFLVHDMLLCSADNP